ncbi:MAG: hypothetical protein JOZ12_13580, partial [Sinobacteraceae bacterium]|nr:hypothetical protein [Nevskiaceae bacterium]
LFATVATLVFVPAVFAAIHGRRERAAPGAAAAGSSGTAGTPGTLVT